MKFEYIPTNKVPVSTVEPTLLKFLAECGAKDSVRIPLTDLKNGRRSVTGILASVARITGRYFTMTNDTTNLYITPKNGTVDKVKTQKTQKTRTPKGHTLKVTHPLRGRYYERIVEEVLEHGTVVIPKRLFRSPFARGHFVVRMRRAPNNFKVEGSNKGSRRLVITATNRTNIK